MGWEWRRAFDTEAARYARARPRCPEAALDRVLEWGEVPAQGRVLEVGCGTGQATMSLGRRGLRVLALDLGEALLEQARSACAPWPGVAFERADFERWRPQGRRFDLGLSVQAFHWVQPSAGLATMAEAIRPGGALALVWHQDRSHETPLWAACDPIYARFMPHARPNAHPRTPSSAYEAHVRSCGWFEGVEVEEHAWSRVWSREAWLDVVQTFSDTIALPPDVRAEFLGALGEAIDAHGEVVPRHYVTRLVLGRRVADTG